MSTQWEFAHTLAQVSTGAGHTPEVRIEHIEMGCYRLSVDKAELVLTAQDLIDVMDFVLLNYRTLVSQAADETPSSWHIRERP